MSQRIVVIDSQRLDSMSFCPTAYNIKFNRGLVPINTADYLERGGLLHEMLAEYYKLKVHRPRWFQNGKSHANIVASCIIVGRHFGSKMQLSIPDIERTIEVFKEYTDYYENDNWNDIIAVEQAGVKVLYESDDLIIAYEVKIDLALRLNGAILSVDHKHAQSRRDPNELANQFKGYAWFLGANHAIVNEIGFQKTVPPKDKFRRHTLDFSDAIITEWKENTTYWVVQSLQWAEDKFYARNFTSCDKYSGCDYKHICNKDPGEYREYRLLQEFKNRAWDVGGKHI